MGAAASSGSAECVRLLIPLSLIEPSSSKALYVAARFGHAECVKLLLPFSGSLIPDSSIPLMAQRYKLPLYAAIDCGRASVVSAMIAHEPEMLKSLDLRSLFADAISQGQTDLALPFSSIIERQALSKSLPMRERGPSPSTGRRL